MTSALRVSQQINAAQRGADSVGDGGYGSSSSSAGSDTGLTGLLPVLSFRPWAPECLWPGWSFRASSAALFALPWAVGAGAAVRPWRRACVLLLDLVRRAARREQRTMTAVAQMYLPVAERAVQWFNLLTLPREHDNVRTLALAQRGISCEYMHGHSASCNSRRARRAMAA